MRGAWIRRYGRALTLGLAVVVLGLLAGAAGSGDMDRLLLHAESLDGTVLASQGADTLFNPASVIKVGTSLWALERLGPEHRYETIFGIRGTLDSRSGVVTGDLVVVGGADPDLQAENVILVARELNRLGARQVRGDIVVCGSLMVGWEHGVAGRLEEPEQRAEMMAGRLRTALDPARWDQSTRAAWQAMCARRGWDAEAPPAVTVTGGPRLERLGSLTPMVRHRSNPLPELLKRFNTYSNNDIIRVADDLGGVARLEAFLRQRLSAPAEELQLETASGEERNRITPRLVVRLMRAFVRSAAALGLQPEDLLPVPGCDPGPLGRMFPGLASGRFAGAVACKSGTLRSQDGEVAALAGVFASTEHPTVLFCVAVPRAGSSLRHWRRIEQSWLQALLDRAKAVRPEGCTAGPVFSDTDALVEQITPVEPVLGVAPAAQP